jgi:hypothetical protein
MYNLTGKSELKWETCIFPNIPFYRTELPDNILKRLWSYVEKATVTNNHSLAGNITKSMYLDDEDNYFERHVLRDMCKKYMDPRFVGTDSHLYSIKSLTDLHMDLVLDKFWVNFQNQNEFNPIHNHGGIFSFVIWMKIPTDWREQHEIPFVKSSNAPLASDFQFTYSDILGNHQTFNIMMDKSREGWMLLFPSSLKHQVYPFYNCDEQRISISGNLALNSKKYTRFFNK